MQVLVTDKDTKENVGIVINPSDQRAREQATQLTDDLEGPSFFVVVCDSIPAMSIGVMLLRKLAEEGGTFKLVLVGSSLPPFKSMLDAWELQRFEELLNSKQLIIRTMTLPIVLETSFVTDVLRGDFDEKGNR